MAVRQLSSTDFHETIKESKLPVLVDFYADWCGPCRRVAPIVSSISDETEGKALICKVNVDENQDLAAEFAVMSIPYLISFKNGEPYKRVVGAVSKSELLALLE